MLLKNMLAIACFSLFSSFVTAQIGLNEYDARWKTADSLINKKGLVQSALLEVNNIYNKAKKEKNDAQLIRALIYRMNLQAMSQEDATKKNTEELEKEIAAAQPPARSILTSILAETYWNYFQQNRWKLYNRTKTVDFDLKKEDIATWGAADFHKKIGELYFSSLREERLLEQTRLESFEPVILKGNARYLRPTLFDLLAHRALAYFKSNERDVVRPAYAFEIDDPLVFADAAIFATSHPLQTADSLSLHFRALQLFQRLIRLHLSDARPDALLDADIERLQFAYQYGVMENKEALYMRALSAITHQYGDEPGAAEAWYLQAQQYANQAARYNPLRDTANRYAYVQAKAICEKVIALAVGKDSSEGINNCQALLKNILRKELVLQTEKINMPAQPLRSLVSWRNFSQLYFRLIRMDHSMKASLGNNPWQDDYWKKLLQLPVLKTFSRSLPETGDYQKHSTEIKIDALPTGEYALLASTNEGFSLDKNVFAIQYFYVSAIAYINHGRNYFVVNRESGQPLAGADVQTWDIAYDYKSGRSTLIKADTYQSDQHGYFLLKEKIRTNRNPEQLVEISMAGDHLFTDDRLNDNYYYNETDEANYKAGNVLKYEKDNLKTFFFTDRSIYRPGQTVYFKGIVVTRDFDTKQSKIVPQFKAKVILYDVNDQKIDSLRLTTNEYGSYHGKFSLPQNLLTGEFRVKDDSTNDQQSFSVEEYKRPKFYVEYEKLKGSYRAGDTIRVTGNAKAYAGNAIDGANVKYRVIRQARFPYPWLYWRGGMPAVAAQEIAHGETRTNADGNFTVVFPALPDRSVSKELEPVFEYKVSADITDINGETRSGETMAPVGYKTLELSISLPSGGHLPADSLKEFFVKTTNLSGEPEPASVNISIYQLRSPGRLIRNRYWPQPDQFVLSKEEYLGAFPHDEYRDETKKESWEREKLQASSFKLQAAVAMPADSGKQLQASRYKLQADTGKLQAALYRLEGSPLKEGWYVIEATAKDKYGQEVKDVQYAELYDGKTGQPASPQYRWAFDQGQTVEPGGKAIVNTGSSASDLFVIRKIERKSGSGRNRLFSGEDRKPGFQDMNNRQPAGQSEEPGGEFLFFSLNKEKKTTEFPVTEADRGGFGVSDIFVKDNRFYTISHPVNVPWTNKELSISYTTYRDKTLPGSEEKWQVRIAGYKGDKVSAEVLAGMYDASLDPFKMHGWGKPYLYPDYTFPDEWRGTDNFFSVQSQQRYINDYTASFYTKIYDRLLSFNQPQMLRVREMAPLADSIGYNLAGQVPGVNVDKAALAGKPLMIQVPDLKNGPDGSKGLTKPEPPGVQTRKNFNETAFFFPDLRTDSAGNIAFSFTMPEALTRWKWMTLAHTKELAFGYSEKSIITRKQLMVQPNMPRFLREGDRMELSAKIVNLTDSELTGQMELQLTDPTTNQPVDGWFTNRQSNQYFTVGAGQSGPVSFFIELPYQYNRPVTYRLVAKARDYSDGEEATLPVVSNRMLVTESLPINLPGNGTRHFKFDKLLQSAGSETLNHHALTVEFTGNPAWYAVQALPYLMEYPYECAEQIFNRFYANALATNIVNSSPRIKEIFAKWKTTDTAALLSNLGKNQELKSVLLEETPWVLQAKSESQQKKNIALLFETTRMTRELESSLNKLQGMQSPNGGFVWFKGGPDDRYITQIILTGIGHLRKLNALPAAVADKINAIVVAALPYADKKIKEDFEELKKTNKNIPLGQSAAAQGGNPDLQAQYLYMRSFFNDQGIPGDVFPAVNYYRKQAQQSWLQVNKYMQGMIALALYRTGDIQAAKDIMASLQQNAIRDDEKGMHWKDVQSGYYWRQAPIETQSLLIEAFHEIVPNPVIDRDLKTWLLKQKQTQSWSTTKATADACYALLAGGADWLKNERNITIRLGDKIISSGTASSSGGAERSGRPGRGSAQSPERGPGTEAGTGYFKKIFDGPFVNPSMGSITVTMSEAAGSGGAQSGKPERPAGRTVGVARVNGAQSGMSAGAGDGGSPAWGAVYWQYFENLDRIVLPNAGIAPLRLSKKLFVEKNTDRGPVLEPVSENGTLQVGDKVKIRIELRADRDLEYVHMKDMRASCMEPVNVLSEYKWQGGLGYYESTKDAGTDFFFSRLPRGVYIFEYPVFVGQTGNFSNGVTSIQCMYAPEFAFHSEGIRVNVETHIP